MTSLRRPISTVLVLAVFAGACADEDLVARENAVEPQPITVTGAGAAAPTPVSGRVFLTPSAGVQRGQVPVFYRVRVRAGDTLASVARTFGIGPEYVLRNNEGAIRGGELVEGALLDVPSVEGIIHRVRLGETLSEIATRYGVDPQAIIDFPANGLGGATAVPPSVILVPGGRRP